MPVTNKCLIPNFDLLVNNQFFQVPVANGALAGYLVDTNTRTLYQKESQIIVPSRHGFTHVAEDMVPLATCDTPGLLGPDDKCKLDSILQMRMGVLGYQGAGFSDDGGFLTGDIILAAGSEFISLERIGNTVRFTVDSPLPLNCGCESCSQIFWIQDESATRSIRPPSCNGVMPDVSAYGELKIYTFPETTIVDPKDPMAELSKKGNYPTLQFKRYVNAITPFENQFEMVLKRNTNLTSNTGWSFTPGSLGVAQCVWYMGKTTNGGQIKFEFLPDAQPGLLGSLLYNGHKISKSMAVVVDYDAGVLDNNVYVMRKWDIQNAQPVGDRFSATNIWQYYNPENSPTATTNPKKLVPDKTRDLLPIGSLVDYYEFELSRTSNARLTRCYVNQRPELSPSSLWCQSGAVRFGDLFTDREEINPCSSTAISASDVNVSDVRLFEKSVWGMNYFDDRLILSDDGGEVEASDGTIAREPSGEPINNDIVADIDPTIPGLKVQRQVKSLAGDINGDGVVNDDDLQLFMCAFNKTIFDAGYNARADFNQDGKIDIRDLAILGQQFDLNVEKVPDRPVFLWNRNNYKNVLVRTKIGQPLVPSYAQQEHVVGQVYFPPYDLLLSAPVDSFTNPYMKIIKRGVFTTGPFAGVPYVVAKGEKWEDLPAQGVIKILTGAFRNTVWRYYYKAAFSNWDDDAVTLIGRSEVFPFDEDFPIGPYGADCTVFHSGMSSGSGSAPPAAEVPTNTTAVELLHEDFTAPCVRFQFVVGNTQGSEVVQLQVKVGTLDMSVPYELNSVNPQDDAVRGLAPGYTVSSVMIQNGFITDGIGAGVTSTPSGFRVYKGGELPAPVNGQVEKWNDVEVMYRDGQVWIWWNGMIINPDTVLSANLPTPVAVNTPYFPIHPQVPLGKVALRMFPGAVMRQMEVLGQLTSFNEYTNSGVQLTN